MKVYTRTGDEGQTGIVGGRVRKNHSRVEAYGTIDELNCFVGQALSLLSAEIFSDLRNDLRLVQHELFDCGSDLANAKADGKTAKVTSDMTERLEHWIDRYAAEAPPITRFILPGGGSISSTLHVCRTVCRRAERRVVSLLAEQPSCNKEVLRYLNRLSDFFFTSARAANVREGIEDIEYIRSAEVFTKRP